MKPLATLLLALCSSFAFAQATIYAIDIPGLHEKSGNGAYDKIINASLVSSGKANLKVVPPTRAERSFETCNNCCWSPANKNPEFYAFGADVTVTEPMGTAKIYIFSKPGSPVYSSLADLTGKKVGIRSGMPYGKSFESANLLTQKTSEISKNIVKLDNGRIDVMIAYVPDAYDAFKSMNKEPYPHDEASPVAVHPDSLVCRGVSQDFIDTFNQHIKNAN